MSQSSPKKVTASTTRRSKRPTRRLALVGLAAVGAVIVLSGGLYLAIGHNHADDPHAPKKNELIINSVSPSTQAALKKTTADYVSQYQAGYDTELAKTSNPSEQAVIYDKKSALDVTVAKYPEAMEFAQKAEALAPSIATAYAIFSVAQSSGDKAGAQAAIQTVIDRLDPNAPEYERSLASYKKVQQGLQS